MQMRPWLLALALVAAIVALADTVEEPRQARGQTTRAEASGVLQPAPVNPRFDAAVSDDVLRSAAGRGGVIEPPGWSLKEGSVRPQKGDGPSGGSYALLHGGQATLESSPFTVGVNSRKLDFKYSIRDAAERPSSFRVYVLSGKNFDEETQVFAQECDCRTDWQKAYVPVAQFAGQTIKLKFVRDGRASAPIGITDIAVDLLQEHAGRDAGSAWAGDPVNTSNGNFMESFSDIPATPGRGVPMALDRYYNSASNYSGGFGPKWTNTYSFDITPEPDGSRTVRYVDGHTANFTPALPVVDAVTTGKGNGPAVTWTHTTTAASNRLLLVGVGTASTGSVSSITYGSQDLQLLSTTASSSRRVTVYYLLNPLPGAQSVTVNLGVGTLNAAAIAETFSNVALAAPVATTANGASGAPSVAVAGTEATDLVVDFVAPNGLTPGSDQTTLGGTSVTLGPSIQSSAEPGESPSVTMSWSSSSNWALIGVRVAGVSSSVNVPVVDAVSTATDTYPGVSWTHTTTYAPSRLLLVGVGTTNSGGVSSVTYGGESMHLLATETSSGRKVTVYYLLNPLSGANTVTVDLTVGTLSAAAVAETFSNIAMVAPVATTATGASGAPTVSVAGTTGNDLVVDFVAPAGLTPGGGQTPLGDASVTLGPSVESSAAAGASPSVTMSWSSASNWALIGVRVQGSGAVASAPMLDAVTTASDTYPGVSWTHTTTSAPGRLLLVAVSTGSTGTVSGVTYGGEQMQLLSTTASSSRKVTVYFLLNPLSGPNTVAVNLAVGTLNAAAIAESFSNVGMVSPVGTTATGASGTPSVTVYDVTPNDLVVDFVAPAGLTAGSGQTDLGSASVIFGPDVASSTAPGQHTSLTMSWSSASNWAMVGVRVPGINTAVSAPIVDTVTTASDTYPGVSWTHTTTSAPGRLLLVSVGTAASGGVSSVTYGDEPMQLLSTTASSSRRVTVYYLLNPRSGANAVTVNLNVGTVSAAAMAQTVWNVGMALPVAASANGASGTPSVTVSGTSARDLVLDFVSPGALTPGNGQSLLGSVSATLGPSMQSSAEPGQSPSVTMSWSTASDWALVGVHVRGIDNTVNAPVVDTVTTAAGAGPLSWTHTTTGAPNRMLLVAVGSGTLGGVSSVTYSGQVMQLLSTVTSSSRKVTVYYMISPPSGANTVTVNLLALTGDVVATAETFSNAAAVLPVATTATGASGTPSVTVSGTTAHDLVVDFVSPNGLTAGTNQTPLASRSVTLGPSMQSSAEPGQSSSVTMSWSTASNWALVGVKVSGISNPTSAPLLDAVTTSSGSWPSVSWTHTTTTSASRLLLVAVATASSGSVSGVTYGGQALQALSSVSSSSRKVAVYYLLNPLSGANTVTVNLNVGTLNAAAVAETFSHAALAPPVATTATGASGAPSVSVSGTSSNDLVVDFVSPNNLTAGSGQTNLGQASVLFGSSIQASSEPGQDPSVTMSWSSATNWALTGVRVAGYGATSAPLSYISPPGNFDQLVQLPDKSYTLTTKAQVVYSFNVGGRLTSIADRNGDTTTVSYNGSGHLSSVTDSSGRSLTFTTNGSGLITGVSDPLGRSVGYSYTNGQLTSMTDVLGGVTTYTYDTNGRNYLVSNSNPLGNADFINTYDDADRVVKQLRVSAGVNTYMCFYYGAWPPYTDANCPGVSPAAQAGQTIVVDARGNKTTYSFNALFKTTEIKDHLGGISVYKRDGAGNLICYTDPRGNRTAHTYDGRGNQTATINALNTDAGCGLKSGGVQTTRTFTARNDLATLTDPLGRQTVYTYDTDGDLTVVDQRNASAQTVKYTCRTVDQYGQATSVTESTTLTNCTGNTTGYGYDSYGNVTAVTDPRFYGQGSPPQTTATYDLGGRQLTVTNELGHTTTTTYNALNRVLTATDHLSHVTTNTYNALGQLKTVTDANSKVTTNNYDNLRRLTSVVDPLSQTTSYAYDANDNRTSVTNPRGKVTTYTFDALNRRTVLTDPLSHSTTVSYDAAGNVTQRTDARGLVTAYTYDAMDRVTLLEHKVSGTTVDSVASTYDAGGNRTQMVDATGTTTTAYDALNRITSVTSPGSVTVSYTYDAVGDRTRITYPDAKTVDYTFDANHRMATVTDWLTKQTSYTYDNAGKLTVTTYPNGVTATAGYDNADRITSVTNANGSTFSSFTYTLDNAGNRTQVVDNGGTTTLQYDNLYRLTQVTYPGPVTDTYSYDANGNRTTKNADTYTYNDADELTAVNGVSYGYDNNGNQTSRASDGFTFDHENRLTQAVVGGTTSSAIYDGTGVRRSHTVNGATTTYVWDVNAGLPVVLQDGTRTYVYGLDLISATDGAGNQSYFSYDAVGSVTDITNGAGAVTDTYVYDVFGTIKTHSGTSTNYWLFTGEQADRATGDTGYYFLRARYYDPALGRFISRDPLLFDQRYAYAGNNPVLLVDPSGLCGWSEPWNCPDNVGGAIVDGAQAVGGAIVDGAKAVIDAIGDANYRLYEIDLALAEALSTECALYVEIIVIVDVTLAVVGVYAKSPVATVNAVGAVTYSLLDEGCSGGIAPDWPVNLP